ELVEETRKTLRRRPASNLSPKDQLRRPSYHISPIMIHPNNSDDTSEHENS
ncbi:hypothetical protein BX616_005739, partial [Lobosporangium transversale]